MTCGEGGFTHFAPGGEVPHAQIITVFLTIWPQYGIKQVFISRGKPSRYTLKDAGHQTREILELRDRKSCVLLGN